MYDRYISKNGPLYPFLPTTQRHIDTETKTGHSIYLYSIFLFYYLEGCDLDPLSVSIHTFFVIILVSRIHDLPR